MLEYSDRAKIGYAELYRKFNKRTIFIEDDSGRYLYEKIVNQIMGAGFVSRIFSLSGKDTLIQRWKENIGSDDIYIVDGDLDLFLCNHVDKTNLIRLPFYCIENGIITEISIIGLLRNYENISENDLKKKFNFSDYTKYIEDNTFNLFILYAAVHCSKDRIVTVKNGLARYCDDLQIVRSRIITEMRRLIRHIKTQMTDKEFKQFKFFARNQPQSQEREKIDYISGKDFLGHLIHKKATKECGFRGDKQIFMNLLADYMDFSQDPFWDHLKSKLST